MPVDAGGPFWSPETWPAFHVGLSTAWGYSLSVEDFWIPMSFKKCSPIIQHSAMENDRL